MHSYRSNAFALLFHLFTALISVTASQFAYAQDVPVIEYSVYADGPTNIHTQMLYLEDPSHALTVETLLSGTPLWKKIDKSAPNFGFTESAYWFLFHVNNTEALVQRAYFELPIPFLDNVHLFRVSEKDVIEDVHVGDQYPFSDRPISHQNFVMPLNLEPGLNRVMLRIETAGTVEAPITIWSPEKFAQATSNDRLLQGIWVGVIGIMIIYNLFLFSLLKDRSYLYYVAFASSYLLFQLSLKGYGFAFIWPDQVHWNSYAISVFVAASNFFATAMVVSFLDLRNLSPTLYRFMLGLAIITGTFLVLTFYVPYSLSVRINSGMTAIACILSLSAGYISWFSGNANARYFCLAWTAAFSGVGILVAAKFGVLPATFWTNNAGEIGILLLVALLSFSLANRFDTEKELRIKAQANALEHEKQARQSQDALLRNRAEANKRLEKKVAERTENLEQTLQQLEAVNKQLAIMSTTDALTALSNRGHFEQCLQEELKRAIRNQRDLSVILCDVDHFKTVNDSYGHKAGDKCLQAIAKLLKERLARSGDVSARYGGEEFIVLLPETTLEQARDVALDLCEQIREMQFVFDSKSIPITASFGVSTLNNVGAVHADQLVTQADISLYEAKNTGRDRVVCWDPTRDGPEKPPSTTSA